MSDLGGNFQTVSEGGYTVISNTETPEQIREGMGFEAAPDPDAEASKAAATLGKKGGEAAAAKRAEAAKAVKGAKDAKPADDASGAGAGALEADAAGKPEAAAEPADTKRGNPRHDPKARVEEATREAREAREEAARERNERLKATEELARLKYEREQAAKPPADAGKPRREQFQTEDEFWDARIAHERDGWQREAAAQRQVEEHQRVITSHQDGLKAKVDEFIASTPDFIARTEELASTLVPTFNISPERQTARNWMADYVLKYPGDAPALLLHLSENDSVLQRIASLRSPHDVYTDMAKISARLEAAPTATSSRTEVSKAKPPVRPVTGSPHTPDRIPDDNAPYEDHKAYWAQRDKAKRK